MENYLLGKCYYVRNRGTNSSIRIEGTIDYGLHYMCRRLVKSTTEVGYFSDTDILFLDCDDIVKDLVEIDPIIWEKIYKILKMNTISCNTIMQNCKRYKSPTGYYISTFPIKLHYKLFEVLEDSQILARFSENQARMLKLETDSAIKFEKMLSTGDEWISSETYNRVKGNIISTIEEIDDIWTSI